MSLDDQKAFFKIQNGRELPPDVGMTRSLTEIYPNGSSTWVPKGTARSLSGSLPGSKFSPKQERTRDFATVSAGSNLSKQIKTGRLPVPQRSQEVFRASARALRSCVDSTNHDIGILRSKMERLSLDGPGRSRIYELEKQMRAAERYGKRIDDQRAKVEELQEQYFNHMRLQQGVLNMQSAYSHTGPRKMSNASSTATNSLRGGIKQLAQALNCIETELEMLMGTINLEMRGIVGFARITPGDVFDVHVRHGNQKWKTRAKTQSDRTQLWDRKHLHIKCLLDDPLEIKVSEVRVFRQSKLLTDQSFDPTQLFSSQPQLLTVNLNSNGSLKLQMVVTWQPVDSGPCFQSSSANESPFSQSSASSSPSSTQTLEKNTQPSSTSTPILPHYTPISVYYNGVFEPSREAQQSPILKVPKTPPPIPSRSRTPTSTPKSTPKSTPIPPPVLELRALSQQPSILALLRAIKPLIQRLLGPYPELNSLESFIYQWDVFIKRKLKQSNGLGNGHLRNSFGMESSLSHGRLASQDDIDDNVIINNGYGSRDSSSLRLSSNERTPLGHVTNGQATVGVGPSERRFRQMRHERRKSLGSAFEISSDVGAAMYGSLERQRPAVIGTGHSELDSCLAHHLMHIEMTLNSLEAVYGPLQYKEESLLRKLLVETKILDDLFQLTRSLPALPNLSHILSELNAGIELQDLWLSATVPTKSVLMVESRALKTHLVNVYARIVSVRYPDLVKTVFDSLMHSLTDESNWNPQFISLYQFVTNFGDKHLATFIESLAHEGWITRSLQTRLYPTVQYVMDRLKQVPVVPPVECVRQIGLLLVCQNTQIKVLAEMYLLRAQGDLRADLIGAFLTVLEHDHEMSRCGAARSLAILNAHQSIRPLAFVHRCDRKASVREEARKALMTFGKEGMDAIDAAAFDVTRI